MGHKFIALIEKFMVKNGKYNHQNWNRVLEDVKLPTNYQFKKFDTFIEGVNKGPPLTFSCAFVFLV